MSTCSLIARFPAGGSIESDTSLRVAATTPSARIANNSHAWILWATEAADVRPQFIAIALGATAGACRKHKPEGDNYRDDNEPVLHGS